MKLQRRLGLFLIYLGLLATGYLLSRALEYLWAMEAMTIAQPNMRAAMIAMLAVYVVASAIPFVPGAEIGLGMIMLLGARIVPTVYLCMILALMLAFLCGRFVPAERMARFLAALGLARAGALVLGCAKRDYSDRTAFLEAHLPKRILPFVLRHRYVALALLLNIPGNTLLGGGGGLAFAAGASRIFGVLPFVVTILLAVSPIPLIVLLTDWLG